MDREIPLSVKMFARILHGYMFAYVFELDSYSQPKDSDEGFFFYN